MVVLVDSIVFSGDEEALGAALLQNDLVCISCEQDEADNDDTIEYL